VVVLSGLEGKSYEETDVIVGLRRGRRAVQDVPGERVGMVVRNRTKSAGQSGNANGSDGGNHREPAFADH
jgi:hypothetical protein